MNLDGDYLGGVYLGKLILPIEYPLKPPSLQMVTPNGRFKTDENICMSFTKYHPESWSPLWNIENMITGLISFMLDDKDTQGIFIIF
jgi:ubiquitin-conjugating enzyme E2 J2